MQDYHTGKRLRVFESKVVTKSCSGGVKKTSTVTTSPTVIGANYCD